MGRRSIFVCAKAAEIGSADLSQKLEDLPVSVSVMTLRSPGDKDGWNFSCDPADVMVVVFTNRFRMTFHRPDVRRYQSKQVCHVKGIETEDAAQGSNSGESVIQS
jgi:hypothetical protein